VTARARRLDYRWNLRQVMAARGMFATTDLAAPLAARGIHLSSSQIYRLVVERPERLSLKVLMALLDILHCSMEDLIEPVAAVQHGRGAKTADGSEPTSGTTSQAGADLGGLRPKRARILTEPPASSGPVQP
jgi:DNA-binding Xre family transcriptional regulator